MSKDTDIQGISVIKGGQHLLVKQNPILGVYNGYVGVSKGNTFYGKHYSKDEELFRNIRVHGGVTYSGKGFDKDFKKEYWYIGFDTAHFGDEVPYLDVDIKEFIKMILKGEENKHVRESLLAIDMNEGQEFRDVKYVLNEVRELAEQLV